ncbi:MAG: hypothetical protein CFH06_01497 [Alphaproteobacteria bacterium MarineAlpha3_Bin5]|nr:DUF1289 domain-containing protein [Magnetovibrio sp.]PPR77027.1 MAG: hypothetical protein CFH06_01497 [Alphaproteobacteria bacterium MarineAlpha3_Bin5]
MNISSEIVSPCISVCKIDLKTGFCLGCWRTRDEIKEWASADTTARLEILGELKKRKKLADFGARRKTRRRG